MRANRTIVAAWIAAGLVALVVASLAAAHPAARPGKSAVSSSTYRGPVASASGGGAAAVTYPGLVDIRFGRSRAAIDRAETAADTAQPALGGAQLTTAEDQMHEAWRATRWLIKTTPPPPPPSDRAGAGGGSAGAGFAAPPQTSLGLFNLQHDLVIASAGLLGIDPALDTSAVSTIQATAAMRLTAIRWIHNNVPPAPPPADRAGASGGAVAATFDSVMPSVLPLLDDEITALRGTLYLQRKVPLPDSVVAAVRAVIAKDKVTQDKINTFWPPIVGDD
jgi:hypothetical protein